MSCIKIGIKPYLNVPVDFINHFSNKECRKGLCDLTKVKSLFGVRGNSRSLSDLEGSFFIIRSAEDKG